MIDSSEGNLDQLVISLGLRAPKNPCAPSYRIQDAFLSETYSGHSRMMVPCNFVELLHFAVPLLIVSY